MSLDRFRVVIFEIEGCQINDTFIRATDPIGALAETVRMGPVQPGEYNGVIVQIKPHTLMDPLSEAKGSFVVKADGAVGLGKGWGLTTPVEPIDRADLGIDVGVPDVG